MKALAGKNRCIRAKGLKRESCLVLQAFHKLTYFISINNPTLWSSHCTSSYTPCPPPPAMLRRSIFSKSYPFSRPGLPPLQSLFRYLEKKLGHLFPCDSTEPHAPLDTHPRYLMLTAPSLGQLPHARKGKVFWKVSMSSFSMLLERRGSRR